MKKMREINEVKMVEAPESANSFVMAFLRGLFVGGATGAVAMFLFAPRSGKRSRAKIQYQYDEVRDQLLESLEDAEEEVLANAHHTAATIRGKVKELQNHR